jgi:hypothetical protein
LRNEPSTHIDKKKKKEEEIHQNGNLKSNQNFFLCHNPPHPQTAKNKKDLIELEGGRNKSGTFKY